MAGLLLGGTKLEQQLIAAELLLAQRIQPSPQLFQAPAAHGTLLGDTIAALGEDVDLAILRQQLHLHPGPGVVPRLVEQRLLQPAQPSLGRADKIVHRRVALAHLGQHVFGRNPSVHYPGAVGLAVLHLDPGKEVGEGRVVGGVAGHHLVSQRQALRRDDQRDHHLDTIRALIAAVAEPALALGRRIDLEVGAGEIVQQHVETDPEQALPARLEERKEVLLVGQQLVQAAVELVDLHQADILAQHIGHGAGLEPLAMQPPLAARIQQPVKYQGLQHVQPTRALAAGLEPRRPEAVQLQLIPQRGRQPAAAPLPRPPQQKRAEPDLHHLAVGPRPRPPLGEQRHLPGLGRAVGEHRNAAAPRRLLAIVDLAKIENVTLNDAATAYPQALDHAPVAMALAVLVPGLAAQKHAPKTPSTNEARQPGRSALQPRSTR